MKKQMILAFGILFLASISLLSGAAWAKEGINERVDRQQARINQGIASGALTRAEADTLQGNLYHIRDTYARLKADGRLTPGEEDRLHKMLDENSQMIRSEKQDSNVKQQKQGTTIIIRKLF